MKLRSCLQAAVASLCLITTPALAENPPEARLYPAIVTGEAIPVGAFPRTERMHSVSATGRSIIVDASSARLYMVENGEVRDSMRVIVGKPETATPELRSMIYYATVNPYWNVPPDLAQSLIAPNVLEQGLSYLDERGYEVVTGFSKSARTIDPQDVDWEAVADGEERIYVRQRPGPANSMGQVKFALANGGDIYLHDTPRKSLFDEMDRQLSNGCVRLEDADRLADWLMQDDLSFDSAAPEQHVALPSGVPIVVTYDPAPRVLASLR